MNKVKNERVAKVALIIGVIAAILLVVTIFTAISMYLSRDSNKEDIEISSSSSTETNNTNSERGISSVIEDSLENNDISSVTKHIEEKVKKSPVEVEEVKIQQEGWTTENLNVREDPNTDANILDVLPFNTYIKYYEYNDEWAEIAYDNGQAYVSLNYIGDEECEFVMYSVPENKGFKSYMPYTAITDKSSKQYKLQQIASTGTYGIRTINGRFLCAIGTAFNAEVGTYFDLILEDGFVIPCIVGDVKNPVHTDSTNVFTKANNCASEFLIDPKALHKTAKKTGDISDCSELWGECVRVIIVYNKNVW